MFGGSHPKRTWNITIRTYVRMGQKYIYIQLYTIIGTSKKIEQYPSISQRFLRWTCSRTWFVPSGEGAGMVSVDVSLPEKVTECIDWSLGCRENLGNPKSYGWSWLFPTQMVILCDFHISCDPSQEIAMLPLHSSCMLSPSPAARVVQALALTFASTLRPATQLEQSASWGSPWWKPGENLVNTW